MTLRLVVLCTLTALVASITLATETNSQAVACVSATDTLTHFHIHNLLASNGITAGFRGSIVHGVYVPQKDVEQAKRLLRADARRKYYSIEFAKNDSVKAAEGSVRQIGLPISNLLMKQEFGTNTALGLFLRSTELAPQLRRYPIVASLRVHERQYQAATNKMGSGYDLQIELHQQGGGWGHYRGWF